MTVKSLMILFVLMGIFIVGISLACVAVCPAAVLPESEPRLSLLVHDDWQQRPQDRALVGWFQADSELSQLRCELYTESSRACEGNLCGVSETLPCVLLQRSDGWVAFKVSGENIPDTAEQLRAGLFGKGNGKRPIYLLPWRRPKPTPAPTPTPDVPIDTEEPDTGQDVQDVPQVADTVPAEAPEVAATPEAEFPSGLAAILVALSVAVTGVSQFTKRVGSFD